MLCPDLVRELAASSGYEIEGHWLEFYGRCEGCREEIGDLKLEIGKTRRGSPMSAFFWRGVRLSLSSGAVMVLALAAGACGGGDGGDSGKVQVVTTLPLFADFVREVGGDRVEVTSLVPAGADPHTFEPSPSDVKKVAEADIAFANGLDLEPSAIRLIEANLKDGAPFVKLGEEAEVERRSG